MLRPFSDFDTDLPLISRRPSWNVFDQNLSINQLPSCSVDLVECGDKYCLHADIPGMQKDNINITLQGHDLTIEGERAENKLSNNHRWKSQERYYGKFTRKLRLPDDIMPDASRFSASYENGVLKIDIPRVETQTQQKPTHRIGIQ